MKMKKQAKYRVKYFTDNLLDILKLLEEEAFLAQHVMYVERNGIFIIAYPGDSVESLLLQYFSKGQAKIDKYYRSCRSKTVQYIRNKVLTELLVKFLTILWET